MDEAPEAQHESKRSRGWFGLIVRLLLVVMVLGWWGAYLISSRFWIADVAVSLGWFVFAIGIVLCGFGLLLRRSWVEALCTLAALMMLVVLGGGRTWLPDSGKVGLGEVQVVEMNIYMANERPDEVLALLRTTGADVMVLVEPQWDVFRRFIDEDDGLQWLPHRIIRRKIEREASPMVVLSRWPIQRDDWFNPLAGVSCVVQRPEEEGGAFRLVGVHVPSPRGGSEWTRGNDVVRGMIESLRVHGDDGIPTMVVGDLNGGPGSYRDRILRSELGVARGSRVMSLSGTFPSNLSILGVTIDDIWVDRGADVRSWERMVIPGSDHFGIRARVLIGDAISTVSDAD